MKYKTIKQFTAKGNSPKMDDDELGMIDTSAEPVYARSKAVNVYKFFIDGPIGEPNKYRNFFACLDAAQEHDVIELHLNTPGGSVFTAIQFRNMISCTQAHVVAICHGRVASAGTMLALSCPEIVVMPNTFFMIHAASWGTWGSQSGVKDEVDFTDECLWELTHDFYDGFLTSDEIEDIIINKREMWMNTDEIGERLEAKFLYDREQIESTKHELEKVQKEIDNCCEHTSQTKKKASRKKKGLTNL